MNSTLFGKKQRDDLSDEVVVCCRNFRSSGRDGEIFATLELQGASQARPGLVDADAEGAYPGCDLGCGEGLDAFPSSLDLGELVGGDADALGDVLQGRVKLASLEEEEPRKRAGVVAVVLDAAGCGLDELQPGGRFDGCGVASEREEVPLRLR